MQKGSFHRNKVKYPSAVKKLCALKLIQWFRSSCLYYLLRFGVPRAATAITVPIKYVPEKVLCTMALASIAHLDVLKMGFGGLRCHMNIYIHRQSYTDVRVASDQSGS